MEKLSPKECRLRASVPPWQNRPAAPRTQRGTIVEQCPRENPMFSGLRAKTLFHRFEIFFRARRAPLKKVEERG